MPLDVLSYINIVTPNEAYVLWCIVNNKNCSSSLITLYAELRSLRTKKILNEKNKLTEHGKSIYEKISKTKISVITSEINEQVKEIDYIAKYISIFPKGMLPSKKPARASRKVIEDSFSWFFKNYNYSWEVILKATQYYVLEFESKNYAFMRNSQYFIRKQNSDKTWDSDLASYCELILNPEDDIGDNFSEKVV